MLNGILLIDKPSGWTSFDVVAKVRGIVKAKTGQKRPKVGHTGTLDPLATGLLVILVGDYCKKAQDYAKLDKIYAVDLELGKTSTTDDAEGELTEVNNTQPSERTVHEVMTSFVGQSQQLPPAFSAIKIEGQRAYKLARTGEMPEMKPRPVIIYSINHVSYNYPKIFFTTEVSSGTYIRSLARDIGTKLDTGAYMTALRRTKVGDFDLAKAHQIDSVTPETIDSLLA